MEKETKICLNSEIKLFDDYKIKGYLVRFTSETEPDLTGDFFYKKTKFGFKQEKELPVFYDHGMNEFLGLEQIGTVKAHMEDEGIFVEGELDKHAKYVEAIRDVLVQNKAVGWSSGVPAHLVKRTKIKDKISRIDNWILAEASLTPTPAEPKNIAEIKSIFEKYTQTDTEEKPMEDEIKAGAKIARSRLNVLKDLNEKLTQLLSEVEPIEDEETEGKSTENKFNIEELIEQFNDDLKDIKATTAVVKTQLDELKAQFEKLPEEQTIETTEEKPLKYADIDALQLIRKIIK